MEVLFVLVVLCGGAYWFFRSNVRRGGEIMRANIFLTALEKGHSVVEANGYASRDMSEVPEQFVGLANTRATISYGGLRLAMVGDAYGRGMHPKLPLWERSPILSAYRNAQYDDAGTTNQPEGADGAHSGDDSGFDSYYAIYIAELRRLAGVAPDDIHPAEIMEDDGPRRAHRDGVPALKLAAMNHRHNFGGDLG